MPRDYQRENERYKSRPDQIAKRVGRNAARRTLKEELGAAALKGKQVEHKDGNPTNNARSNLKLVSPAANNNGRRGGPARGGK